MKDTKWMSKGENGVYQAYPNARWEVFASDLVSNEACFYSQGNLVVAQEMLMQNPSFGALPMQDHANC